MIVLIPKTMRAISGSGCASARANPRAATASTVNPPNVNKTVIMPMINAGIVILNGVTGCVVVNVWTIFAPQRLQ
jgi:hypothetical protein